MVNLTGKLTPYQIYIHLASRSQSKLQSTNSKLYSYSNIAAVSRSTSIAMFRPRQARLPSEKGRHACSLSSPWLIFLFLACVASLSIHRSGANFSGVLKYRLERMIVNISALTTVPPGTHIPSNCFPFLGVLRSAPPGKGGYKRSASCMQPFSQGSCCGLSLEGTTSDNPPGKAVRNSC